MAYANYRVTVTDNDYYCTTYTTWVSAGSKTQALVKAAALIGGEKTRREWQRMHREPVPETLLDPLVTVERVSVDEFWDHQDQVAVRDTRGSAP